VSLRRIRLVAWHVFKENIRDRVLYGIAIFALLLVAISTFVGQLSAGEDVKIVKDFALATIELAGIVMTVFVGVGLVSKEIDRRSVYALLARPLPRWEFIVGKYSGLVLTLLVNIALMTVALFVVLGWVDRHATAQERGAWEAVAADPRLFIAIGGITLELAVLTALAIFVSSFSSSTLLSIGLTIGLLFAGWFSADLRRFPSVMDAGPVVGRAVSTIGWLLPAFSAFDVKSQIVHGLPVPPLFLLYTLAYAIVYSAGLLVAAVLVFSRRDFK
jgi:ABC-type transport system involved in multi-copper enzyme maturation permease subunit